jgi:hypothetical protein
MLSKHDIESMTDGQREILAVGMKMEQDRILRIVQEERIQAESMNSPILSATLTLIEVKVKMGGSL